MKNKILAILLIILTSSNLPAQIRINDIDTTKLDRSPAVLSQSQNAVPLESTSFWNNIESNINTTGMIWRDCNNDGYIDVFFSNGNDITISPNYIYLSNRGTLPTSASWVSDNDAYSGHCAVGDIDDNGYPDFIVANYLGLGRFTTFDSLDVYYNYNGIPTQSPGWHSDDSLESFSCALGDVDNDGDLDLAVATGDGYYQTLMTDRIYYNINGTFESRPSWESAGTSASMDITWGDVDNDGDLDLAVCADTYGAYMFLNNSGTMSATPSWKTLADEPANTLIFADANNDNWLDVIVAFNNQLGTGGHFRLFLNDGSGNLSTTPDWQSATGGYGSGVAVYDYDNDGDYDLAAGRWFDAPRVYENIGGTFSSTPVWQANESIVVEELAWVDVDADGVELFMDTIVVSDGRRLFYTNYNPLYSIDSVKVDGILLTDPQYCFDLVSGWVSLGVTPVSEVIIYYKYSFKADLAVSDWSSVNSIFANTNQPNIKISADTTIGFAPLDVQFYDSSAGASQWEWSFGTGDGSSNQNPIYTYNEAGLFDVSLRNLHADGWHYRIVPQMIAVLADTMTVPHVEGSFSQSIEIAIIARNNFPVDLVYLPFEFGGPLPLKYDSFSTAGCRTEQFDGNYFAHIDDFNKRRILVLDAGTQSEMTVGFGKLVKLYFHIQFSNPGLTTPISIDGYLGTTSEFNGRIINYEPFVNNGSITEIEAGCCIGIRGNADNGFENPPVDHGIDIGDIVYLVEYQFGDPTGPEPVCFEEADVNADDSQDIGDIVYLVEFQFGDPSGPLPLDCP